MSSKTEARAWWLPAGLALLALVVRLPGLNGGLWADEIYSAVYAFRTPFPASLWEFHGDNKHPFYSILAHASLSVFGEAPWALRLPAVAFGVATIPMLYALGRRLTTTREAAFASAILAVSYHHAWFSQNARGYSVLAFCAVASTWLLVRVLREGDGRAAAGFAVCIAIGAYTHLTFVFAVLAQFLVALLAALGWPRRWQRPDWRVALGMFAVGGALSLLFYAPMLQKVISFFLHKESFLQGVSSPSWAVAEAIRVLQLGVGGGVMLGAGLVVLVAAAVVGLSGLVSYWRSDIQVALLFTLPAASMLGGAFAGRGTMYPRFFFPLVGFALLIGVRGAFVTARWLAQRLGRPSFSQRGAEVALWLVLAASAASLPRNWRLPKQDYEGALRFVDGARGPGDAVGTVDMTTEIYGRYFEQSWHDVRDVATLEELRRDRTLWLVYTFPRYLARYNARLAVLVSQECRSARVFPGSVSGGEVLVCTLSPKGT